VLLRSAHWAAGFAVFHARAIGEHRPQGHSVVTGHVADQPLQHREPRPAPDALWVHAEIEHAVGRLRVGVVELLAPELLDLAGRGEPVSPTGPELELWKVVERPRERNLEHLGDLAEPVRPRPAPAVSDAQVVGVEVGARAGRVVLDAELGQDLDRVRRELVARCAVAAWLRARKPSEDLQVLLEQGALGLSGEVAGALVDPAVRRQLVPIRRDRLHEARVGERRVPGDEEGGLGPGAPEQLQDAGHGHRPELAARDVGLARAGRDPQRRGVEVEAETYRQRHAAASSR
jgi:hypothetical protein